ncbi:MAG TPA: hypothetical protein VFF96_12105 [Pseudoxanthomonas sp.]|nr:hypothetical protein [Pseudoxanthomonas sp.]
MAGKRFVAPLLFGIALLFGGRAPAADRGASAEPGMGLAFGAFDTRDSEVAVTHVVLMRIKPTKMYLGASGERATVTFEDGRFYSPNLSPGTYAVNGFFSGNQFFALEKSLRMNTVQVESGRASYAGSYRLQVEKGGLLRRYKGSFERIDAPDAESTLRHSLAAELAGSGWEAALKDAQAPR